MTDDTAHGDILTSASQGQLRSVIERIERLEQEKTEIAEQITEVFAEAKGNGFDVKVLRKTRLIGLPELRAHPQTADMVILRRGNRLSITPVTQDEWDFITGTLMALPPAKTRNNA